MSNPPAHAGSRETIGTRGLWGLLVAAAVCTSTGAAAQSATDPTAQDVSGPLAEFRAIAERLHEGSNPYLGVAQVQWLRDRLAAQGLPPARAAELHTRLGYELLRLGDTQGGGAQMERALEFAKKVPDPFGGLVRQVLFARGVAFLREAEVANCVRLHNADCCILPLRGGGVHADPTATRKARDTFAAYLRWEPQDLTARWLLNIVAQALANDWEGLPEELHIPDAAFASEQQVGRFLDVAPLLGVDAFNLCGGAAVEDFDGDGQFDIVTSTFDPDGPLTLYRGIEGGRYTDATQDARLASQLGGLNLLAADYDNDGDMDLLVLRGAWLFDDGQIRNSLLANDGNARFTDVTRQAGLAEPACPTQAAVWLDYDLDGDLDLFVGNESRMEFKGGGGNYPSQLFRNDGDGTFTDVAGEAGVTNDRYCKGVTAGDYDNDGDADIYVSNEGRNRLYRNDGDGSFTDVAPALDLTHPEGRSFATWFFDYDNDGWLDLFVAAYDATVADVAAEYAGRPHHASLARLYHNDGQGGFRDMAPALGLDGPYLPMGANFGDIDNDGWLDIYLATGDPSYTTLTPNLMLRNDGGKRFADVTTAAGLGHLQKGHGVAFADLDGDGDQDLYNQLGGFYPGDKFHNALYVNPGNGNRYLHVELVGTASNRRGVGARVRVDVETPRGARSIHRAVGSVSSFGGSPLRQEIGLGDASGTARVLVWWPVSGRRQLLEQVPLDAVIRVAEDGDGFERLDPPRR